MKTEKSAKTVNTSSFWTEEKTDKVIELYRASLNEVGALVANEQANLKAIADAVGAKSASSVRSKLTNAGVYEKADKPHKVGGGSSVRKIHYVRALVKRAQESGINIESDALDSLESAKVDALKIVAKMVGVTVTAE